MNVSLLKNISNAIGASEDGLTLVFSLFLTFPMAWLYRYVLKDKGCNTKYLYFAICGIFLSVLNYGVFVYHSVVAVLFTYICFFIVPPSKYNVILNFAFHMSYLLIGYKANESDDYDFTWTMPHCVLALRLIGLSFDLWDGTKNPAELSESFKKSALREKPSLLQLFSYVFFPSSYLVGPQFSMNRLTDFVEGKFEKHSKSTAVNEGLKRAMYGILYLSIYQIGNIYMPLSYFTSDGYKKSSFIWKHVSLAILTKVFLPRYIACWLITEGSCMSFGIAYNGEGPNGKPLWDGCKNVDLKIYEGTLKYGHYIESFNINTNAWALQYIYKRLAFLGNRHISRAGTVFFLALWHGLQSGYFVAFFMQFIIMIMEKDLEVIFNKSEVFKSISQNKLFNVIIYIPMKLYSHIYLGWAILAFELLSFDKYWPIYKSLYFSGYVVFIPYMFLYRPILMNLLKLKKPNKIKSK